MPNELDGEDVHRRSRSVVPAWLLALGLLPAAAWGAGPAVGEEFQVNSYTTSYQTFPSVGVAPDGAFVVVWESYGSYGSDTDVGSVQGQRYASDGTPLGGEFQVNSYTTSYQYLPAVAVALDGVFVVAWESHGSYGSDTDGYSIQARRYAADGTPLGGQFQVNFHTPADQFLPALAAGADGAFVVVWKSEGSSGSDTDGESVQGQRYASDGTPLGGQFQVNSYTTSSQAAPFVGMASDTGAFVVAWESDGSYGSDTDRSSIQGQRYAADGTPLGGEFQINSYTTLSQTLPSVAVVPGGDFVVVWESGGSSGSDIDSTSIQGQRYAADGTPLGDEFQVNSYSTGSQDFPSVDVEPSGAFVVTWMSSGSYGSDTAASIQGQRYASDGAPVGGEFQVNSYTTSVQLFPSVGVAPGGDFVVVWDSYGSSGSDTDSFSAQGQRFSPMIFADGFESGDTSAWSATVP